MLMSGFSKRIEKRFCPVDEAIYDPLTNPNSQMSRGDQVKPNGHLDGEHACPTGLPRRSRTAVAIISPFASRERFRIVEGKVFG